VSEFPPRDYLAHLVKAISKRLPEDYAYLLEQERFSEEVASLERLRRPEHLSQAIRAMRDVEAAWLAERLLARWSRIGEVKLEPAVAIQGPDEVWLGDAPRTITLNLATLGVEEGWRAQWMGDLSISEDGQKAQLNLEPPVGEEPVRVNLGVRLLGRAEGARCVLSAQRCIEVRRALVDFDAMNHQLRLRDQTGRPGECVALRSGDWTSATDLDGIKLVPESVSLKAGLGVGSESMDVTVFINKMIE
jgi:hypothetical protein